MNTFRRNILNNWNVMRALRLILGLWILIMAVKSHDITMIFLSTFLVLTAIFGVGCCGVNGCYVQSVSEGKKLPDEVEYDEIK